MVHMLALRTESTAYEYQASATVQVGGVGERAPIHILWLLVDHKQGGNQRVLLCSCLLFLPTTPKSPILRSRCCSKMALGTEAVKVCIYADTWLTLPGAVAVLWIAEVA